MSAERSRPGNRIRAWVLRLASAFVLLAALFVGSCSVASHRYDRGFAAIEAGHTEQDVVLQLGVPSVREPANGAPFLHYADRACTSPCHVRLWYENRMSLAGEAWSFELDDSGRVLTKARWVSP